MKLRYIVIEEKSLPMFEKKLTRLINCGYNLVGGVSYEKGCYRQALAQQMDDRYYSNDED